MGFGDSATKRALKMAAMTAGERDRIVLIVIRQGVSCNSFDGTQTLGASSRLVPY